MVLNKTQRNILFALGIMKGKKICLDDLPLLCRSIDRSDLTIRRNFGKLVKMGLLTKKKIKYSFYFLLTDEGSDEFNELMNEYDHLYFTPRKHNVPVSFKVVEVIGLVKDPFHKIFILNLFFQKKKFDLMRTIDSLGMIESENSLNIMIRKSKLFDDHAGPSNFAYCLLDSSLYTYDLEAIKNIKDWSEGTYEGYAMQGELMIQRGQYEDAYQLFSTLMKINNLPEDIRFVLDIGVIKSLHGLDRLDEMRSLIRTLKNTMKNKIALAFLKQIEADILSMKGEKEKAAVLFDSCIRTFRHYHYSVFLAIAHNNYGVLYFNEEEYDEAENNFILAKRYAVEADNEYLIANISVNLASISRKRDDLKRCGKLLEEVETIYLEQNNLEKLSSMEYNRSLLLLSLGDMEGSFGLFLRSLNDTFPLLSNSMRSERVKVYSREIESLKYSLIQNGRKIELVYNG